MINLKILVGIFILLILSVVSFDLYQSAQERVEPFTVTIDGEAFEFNRPVSLESLEPSLFPFQSFEGFYLDEAYTQPFNEEVIQESITLYANVPPITRNTSLYEFIILDGEGDVIRETVIYHGTPINFILTQPGDDDFVGYYSTATCPDFPVDLKAPVLGDVTLYELYESDFLSCAY